MERKTYQLNTLLTGITAIFLVIFAALKAFLPALILPAVSIPNLVFISLIALLTDYFLTPDARRCYFCIPVFSALTFGVLPLCAGLIAPMEALKLAILGGAVFTATTYLFTSLLSRLSTGRHGRLAAIAGAVGLLLASQAFLGFL